MVIDRHIPILLIIMITVIKCKFIYLGKLLCTVFIAYHIGKYEYYNIVKYFTVYAYFKVELNRYAFFSEIIVSIYMF